MSIDTSGEWWVGSAPSDIREFLEAYSEDGYKVTEFTLSRCSCGGETFHLEADDDEGCASRTCTQCQAQHYICDSEEHWEDAAPETWECIECPSSTCNVGVGFSLYEGSRDIKWLYVGCRCSKCGILGCFTGWKVGYGDSESLISRA